MPKTWFSHGPSGWFFLNLSHCAQGCSMQKFTLLGLSCIPLSEKWPKYGCLRPNLCPHMVLKIGSSWILINVPGDVPCQISHCWVYPVAPFLRNGQNMALLWPKHGPHIVLQISLSWILFIVPRDVTCQISHCWVYPLAPFPRNGQSIALYGQNMVLKWSLKLVLSES